MRFLREDAQGEKWKRDNLLSNAVTAAAASQENGHFMSKGLRFFWVWTIIFLEIRRMGQPPVRLRRKG